MAFNNMASCLLVILGAVVMTASSASSRQMSADLKQVEAMLRDVTPKDDVETNIKEGEAYFRRNIMNADKNSANAWARLMRLKSTMACSEQRIRELGRLILDADLSKYELYAELSGQISTQTRVESIIVDIVRGHLKYCLQPYERDYSEKTEALATRALGDIAKFLAAEHVMEARRGFFLDFNEVMAINSETKGASSKLLARAIVKGVSQGNTSMKILSGKWTAEEVIAHCKDFLPSTKGLLESATNFLQKDVIAANSLRYDHSGLLEGLLISGFCEQVVNQGIVRLGSAIENARADMLH